MFWWHTHQKRRKKGNHRGRLASCCHMNVYCISVSIAGVRQVFYSVLKKKNICNSHNSLISGSIERIPKLPESTDSAIFSSTAPQRRRLVERRESEGRKRKSSTENRTFYLFSFDLLGFFFVVFFFLFSVLFAKYWLWALLGITVMTFISLKRTVSAFRNHWNFVVAQMV